MVANNGAYASNGIYIYTFKGIYKVIPYYNYVYTNIYPAIIVTLIRFSF